MLRTRFHARRIATKPRRDRQRESGDVSLPSSRRRHQELRRQHHFEQRQHRFLRGFERVLCAACVWKCRPHLDAGSLDGRFVGLDADFDGVVDNPLHAD